MADQHDESAPHSGGREGQRGIADAAATQKSVFPSQIEMPAVALDEHVRIHEVLGRIACAMLPPGNVVTAACADLPPFFVNLHFTIAVYFPETHLFVIHTPGRDPRHVGHEESLEGYFLHHPDEDLLAIVDHHLWTVPPPLNLARRAEEAEFRSSLLVASRIHNNLIGVVGLQSEQVFVWDAREVEMLRAAAMGFGLAYYHAVLSDNLIYSCREASQRLADAQREARDWRYRAEQINTAAEIARTVGIRPSTNDLLVELLRILGERWPDYRITSQRYIRESDTFQIYPVAQWGGTLTRPAQSCVQKLFLNNVPVTHITCESPQEIATYGDLDPQFVRECESERFGSFCSAPIYLKDRLWGTITLQAHETGICSVHAELLTEIGRALALPIQTTEMRERLEGGSAERSKEQ